MKWKQFKERVEKELKLIRPELNVDEMDISDINIVFGVGDKDEISVGTDLNNNIIVDN